MEANRTRKAMRYLIGSDNQGFAHTVGVPPEVDVANADLMCAAPDLLAAAQRAQCGCSIAERESGHLVDCWMPDLLAAIAKATVTVARQLAGTSAAPCGASLRRSPCGAA